jgi:hypothetical protein
MQTTTYWYDTHMWSLYAIYIGQFQTPALLIDGSLLTLLYRGMSDYDAWNRNYCLCLLAGWILFSKIIKMIPHFLEFPQDMVFIPGMIIRFGDAKYFYPVFLHFPYTTRYPVALKQQIRTGFFWRSWATYTRSRLQHWTIQP